MNGFLQFFLIFTLNCFLSLQQIHIHMYLLRVGENFPAHLFCQYHCLHSKRDVLQVVRLANPVWWLAQAENQGKSFNRKTQKGN